MTKPADTQVVILCGGQGTRAYPYTQAMPKALMEVGGVPIVEHVMRIYARHGVGNFILSLGHMKEAIQEWVASARLPWDVVCADTGASTDTGGRIWNLRHLLRGRFHATYCDGLSDIDIGALTEYHESHGRPVTITGAPLRSQYGIIGMEADGCVNGFQEKPILENYWINGGFLVFEQAAFDHWAGDNLERDVLPALARRGDLYTYRHNGFWRSMDTYKDQQELNALWAPHAERIAASAPDQVATNGVAAL